MQTHKKEQVSVLNELTTMTSNLENIDSHNGIFAGDFNIFFDILLNAKRGTPTLKSRYINPFHVTGLFRYPLKTSENF